MRMRSLSAIADQLCQNAAGRLRVDERHLQPEEAAARRLVDQQDIVGLQPRQLDADVGDGEGDVVHPGTALGEEAPDGRLGGERLEQLDARFPDAKRCRLDTLLVDPLPVLERRAEQVGVDEECRVEILDGDAQVVDAQCHSRSRIAYTTSLCHSPFTHSFSTSSASRRMPSFSSTRTEAALRASVRPITRWKPRSSNATRRNARAASVA